MHTAPIAILPIHPTRSTERHESHGDAFANHLREEAPEKSRYDEPRPQKRDERHHTEANSRAQDKNDEGLSSSDKRIALERPKVSDDIAEREKNSELPDTVAAASNSVDPLAPPEEAPQSFRAELSPLNAVNADPTDNTSVANTSQQKPAQAITPSLVATPSPELGPDGSIATFEAEKTASGTIPTAPEILGEAALPDTKDTATSQIATSTSVGQTPQTPSLATSVIPPGLSLPPEGNEASPVMAATIATANGMRVGINGSNQNGTDKTSTNGLTEGQTQAGEAHNEADTNLGSTNRANSTSAEMVPNQPGSAATDGNVSTKQSASHEITSSKEFATIPDTSIRSNDVPAPSNFVSTAQSSSTASAFGSELKLAGDTSLTSETAAARNTPNTAASQVAVQINRAVQNGLDKFVVNLKPGTLGKISVQLEIGHDNRVIAVIAAERPETLELLQRDSRALELALKEAGLKADSNSLNFSLQGNSDEESPFEDSSGSNHTIAVTQGDGDLETIPTQNTHAYTADASGVDIHV